MQTQFTFSCLRIRPKYCLGELILQPVPLAHTEILFSCRENSKQSPNWIQTKQNPNWIQTKVLGNIGSFTTLEIGGSKPIEGAAIVDEKWTTGEHNWAPFTSGDPVREHLNLQVSSLDQRWRKKLILRVHKMKDEKRNWPYEFIRSKMNKWNGSYEFIRWKKRKNLTRCHPANLQDSRCRQGEATRFHHLTTKV